MNESPYIKLEKWKSLKITFRENTVWIQQQFQGVVWEPQDPFRGFVKSKHNTRMQIAFYTEDISTDGVKAIDCCLSGIHQDDDTNDLVFLCSSKKTATFT